MNKKQIEFNSFYEQDFYLPKPAMEEIPPWFKKANPYLDENISLSQGKPETSTIKRCVPVFDAITTGYILYLQTDIHFKNSGEGKTWFFAGAPQQINNFLVAPIETHGTDQLQNHPNTNKVYDSALKFTQPYGITTPMGYSCFFTTPVHRGLPFKIFEGIVDTDSFTIPVNFPFYFIDKKFEGTIEAGTPIAQIFPFKRTSFKMKIGEKVDSKTNLILKQSSSKFKNFYRNNFWSRKEYE